MRTKEERERDREERERGRERKRESQLDFFNASFNLVLHRLKELIQRNDFYR